MTSRRIGRAYGFFYCSAPISEIERELPRARENVRTPNALELKVHEGIDSREFEDARMKELAETAKNQGNNYTVVASLPGETNARTAGELGDIQNSLYASPLQQNFLKDGQYLGGIVYKKGRGYRFKD